MAVFTLVHVLASAYMLPLARVPGSTVRAPLPLACAAEEDAFKACMAMKVSELKAELDLRKIGYDGLFEKEEYARRLAEARSSGRADPTLLEDFNKQSAEASFSGAADVDGTEMADAVSGDGGLPGGMSPEALQSMMQNPELMALIRNPKMQEVMKAVMDGGADGAAAYMDDPEVKEMLEKWQSLAGGAGGAAG